MRAIYISLLFILITGLFNPLISQSIEGWVMTMENDMEMPLPGANVYWLNSDIGTTSDLEGKFSIQDKKDGERLLVFSYVGFRSDTIDIADRNHIKALLSSNLELPTLKVEGKKKSSLVSVITPFHTIKVDQAELRKAACCNLSESFETTAAVQVEFSDGVTGSKEIKMLGLDGVYTFITSENMPYIRGLSRPYGITFLPGTWIESLQISKGTGTVVNGYEAITGQINLELNKPDKSDRFFLNLFGNQFGRAEINTHASHRFSAKTSTLIMAHASTDPTRVDHNGDGFMDMPMTKRLNLLNRWKFILNEKLRSQIGFSYIMDDRLGGQMEYKKPEDINNGIYGIDIQNRQFDAFIKTGMIFPDDEHKSVGLIVNFKNYEQKGLYGLNHFIGMQNTLHANLIFQDNIGQSDKHIFRGGASFLYDDIKETLNSTEMARIEQVPGIYGEYALKNDIGISMVAGARLDFHNLHGTLFTPKANIKYSPKEGTVFRISAGRGFRTANIVSENSSVLTSSRSIELQEDLQIEEAWNFGFNFVNEFKALGKEGSISIDFNRTQFQNQIILDLDQDVRKAVFYNLKGASYSNSFQAELAYELLKGFDIRVAYIFEDVKVSYSEGLLEKPLTPRHKALLNLAYTTKYKKWAFDFTTHWYGKQRLPDTKQNPEPYRLGEYSPDYFHLIAQITKRFKHFEIYLGGENLLNYKQNNPIIAADDPFGTYFDASIIWGPITGTTVYGGLRLTLPYK